MTTTTSGPRPLTETEREAVALHLQKVPGATITARTGLSAAQICAAVDQTRAAAKTVAVPSAPKPAPKPPAAPKNVDWDTWLADTPGEGLVPATSTTQSDNAQSSSTSELLDWAERSGQTRPLTLAARIRAQLAELRTIRDQHQARAHAQAEVDRLTAELEAAKEVLRQAGGKTAAAKPPAPAAPRPADSLSRVADVRKWAQQNGYPIAPLGRIPRDIQAAYDTAHGGTQ